MRGDSTLRGHFPAEPEAVEEVLGEADVWVLCPFFLQGGRYTIGDVHYVAEGEMLVPVGETPFARDATFGYRSSDLRDWVVEKSKGGIERGRVHSLSLEAIREGGEEGICEQLWRLQKGSVVVVNAAAEEDVDIVVLGILEGSYTPLELVTGSFLIFFDSSCRTRKTLPLSYRCSFCLRPTSNLSHSSNIRIHTFPFKFCRWLDHCRIVRPENYCAVGILDLWSRFKAYNDYSGC